MQHGNVASPGRHGISGNAFLQNLHCSSRIAQKQVYKLPFLLFQTILWQYCQEGTVATGGYVIAMSPFCMPSAVHHVQVPPSFVVFQQAPYIPHDSFMLAALKLQIARCAITLCIPSNGLHHSSYRLLLTPFRSMSAADQGAGPRSGESPANEMPAVATDNSTSKTDSEQMRQQHEQQEASQSPESKAKVEPVPPARPTGSWCRRGVAVHMLL